MSDQSPEHNLIYNAVMSCLAKAIPATSNVFKHNLATTIAIELRSLVRVKERDE